MLTRTDIINHYIRKYNYKSYLEIGVYDGKNFKAIQCENKVGVDPDHKTKATVHTDSDTFFYVERDYNRKYDLIFIDGLHHSDQVFRDISNALFCLNENGTIIVHDCNPTTYEMQVVPQRQGIWTGDVWKAWMKFRQREDLTMFVYDTDYGVGVIRRGKQVPIVVDNPSYTMFDTHKKEWLPLVPPILDGVDTTPQISICIPTYEQRGKGVEYLKKLFDSILMQKGIRYEVCVSDNSDDNEILELCEFYDMNGLTIRHQFNPNKGVSVNTNAAIAMASCHKIKIMYQDDLFSSPNALKRFADELDKHGWVISGGTFIDGNGSVLHHSKPGFRPHEFEKNFTGMPSIIGFKKCDARFDEEMKTFLDMDFYFQLHKIYGYPGLINERLIYQRYHDASQSRNQKDHRDIEIPILKQRYL